ncbi:2-dehydro-3-deoxyglucarate aldolase [Candidatus Bathyarchaeota archaeon]|nr:2-dehydro-3-deoxyglucarate aldolase [Candidatus Bathyarchaeota archaeon]
MLKMLKGWYAGSREVFVLSANIIKNMLREGKVAIGTSCGLRDPVDLLADSGFDFIFFDTQHTDLEIKDLKPQMQAMKGRHATPIVRVGENNPALICYALDIGAKGIIIPMVNTKEEAVKAVQSCKYPPEGFRSAIMSSAQYWGTFKSFKEYSKVVNDGVLVLPQIETAEALSNLEEILSVPGVDVALVGPSDLSISMGMPEEYYNPVYQDALDKIVKACNNAGVIPGSWFIPGGMEPNKFIEKGFRLFTLGWRRYLTNGVKTGLAEINR